MCPKQVARVSSQAEVKEGASINGVVKSIKGHCMFVQVGHSGKTPQIGRLHRIESQEADFKMSLGERITVKILKVTEGKFACSN